MGGSVTLVAEFPDRDPVVLTGISLEGLGRKPVVQEAFIHLTWKNGARLYRRAS
jgi:hypothetical protein